jgi:MinD-like ATPase involved in chromosome partitioning or flagellar assembly
MTVAGLALALDRRTEDRLLPDMVEHGHSILARVATARDMIATLAGMSVDVAIVGASRVTLTAALIAECDGKGVRLIALTASEPECRYAASLGLYEVIDAHVPWLDIETMLAGGVVVPLRVGDGTRPAGAMNAGTVIAVWGPAGAPGRTTLAINIAAEIAAAGHTVALADVDTYSGSVAPSLGMLDEAPGFAAACRLAGADSLTVSELERIAQRYNSPQGAFWVLTGIGRPSRWPELSADRVNKTVQALRHWVDYVVIDTGFSLESDEEISSDLFAPRRNAATVSALRQADHVVACGLADPVGMARFLRAWVELADVLDTERVSVVMNRVRASAIGLDPAGQVVSTLRRFGNIESPVLVPHDQQGTDAAVLTGRTLRDAAPKSPARASIRRFVRSELLAEPAGAAATRAQKRAGGRRPKSSRWGPAADPRTVT